MRIGNLMIAMVMKRVVVMMNATASAIKIAIEIVTEIIMDSSGLGWLRGLWRC